MLQANHILAPFGGEEPVYYIPYLANAPISKDPGDFNTSVLILDIPYMVYYRVLSMCVVYAGTMSKPRTPQLGKGFGRFHREFEYALSREPKEMVLHVGSCNTADCLQMIQAMLRASGKFKMVIVLPGQLPMPYIQAKSMELRPWFA